MEARNAQLPIDDIITNSRKRYFWSEFQKHIYIVLLCVFILFPLFLMIDMSLKNPQQIVYDFFKIMPPFHIENYKFAWEKVSPLVMNSVIMAGGSAAFSIIIASLAAYAFAKLRFPGRELIFWIIFVKMMLPGVMNLVPSFVLAWHLGLLDTPWAVILFAIGGAQPFWVFVMRTFISQQPQDLFDAARIDGANELKTFWNIAVPLLRPMLTLMAINCFINVWNDYIWPLVTITTPAKKTLTVGLAYLTSGFPGDYGSLMAGYVLASIPLLLLFILGMKQFIAGLTAGSIKM